MMRRTSLILLGLTSALFASGCDPDSESVGEAESSSGEAPTSTEATTVATSGPAQTSDAPTSGPTTTDSPTTDAPTTDAPTTGSNCELGQCGACPEPLIDASFCQDGEAICDCVFGGECELGEITADALEDDPSAPDNAMDCGTATLDDTLEHWTQVRDCALSASGSGTAFKAIFQSESIDSLFFNGYVGLTTPEYGITDYWSDDLGGHVVIERSDCGLISDLDGCTLAVGQECFSCTNDTDYSSFCEAGPK